MRYDGVIVGAGPGGLACAAELCRGGLSALVVERKAVIGPKACAGGITWSGLLRTVPESLLEQAFPCQHVHSRLQAIRVREETPIIATIDRKNLGHHMAEIARRAGATIATSTSLLDIAEDHVELFDHPTGKRWMAGIRYVVGADGSSSRVRRHLGIPTEKVGLGINFQLAETRTAMEWHVNSKYFANGYGWIFPHSRSISVGAYIPTKTLSASLLKERLISWALTRGIDLRRQPCTAGYINYDYRGHHFDNYFLIGDAGGFASALTGEGIYPAIISGEAVARQIVDPGSDPSRIKELLRRQRRFAKMVSIISKNTLFSVISAELGVFALRSGMVDFTALEMGR